MQMNGMGAGFDPVTLLPAAMKLLGPSSGGGGSMLPSDSGIRVSPAINTQVSPQISPVFQQQFQPQNSAASAGTSQFLPTTQSQGSGAVPGSIPGMSPFPDAPSAAGFNTPFSPVVQDGAVPSINPAYIAIGAVAVIAVVMYARKRRGNVA